MRCEEVLPLLPEFAEGRLGDPEVRTHLASCRRCSAELARYRAMLAGLQALRETLIEPPQGFLGRVLASVPPPEPGWRRTARRLVADQRVRYGALSVGGAVIGAAAIGLLWRRAARRAASAALS